MLEFKFNPLVNAGLTLYVNIPVPPLAVTGMKLVAGIFCINVVVGIAKVVVIGFGITCIVKVLLADCK